MNKDRKTVIWGTGLIATRYAELSSVGPIEFFIDNDLLKDGTDFLGKVVCHPSKIFVWNDLFIIIANRFYEEIKEQLLAIGLKEKEDFVSYKSIEASKVKKNSFLDIQMSLKILESKKDEWGNKVLIFSDFLSYDKGLCKYFKEWGRILNQNPFILFSEATWISEKLHKEKVEIPIHVVPELFGRDVILNIEELSMLSQDMVLEVLNDKVLKWSLDNLEKSSPKMSEKYRFNWVYYADFYLQRVLEILSPMKVISVGAFFPFHEILINICNQKKIPIIHTHPGGALPGTIPIEEAGEMGESYPATQSEKFKMLPVTKNELNKANDIWTFLKKSGINRKFQPITELDDVIDKLNPEQKTILYAGESDFWSCLQPYTERTQKFHSPIFKSSLEAAIYLGNLAKKNKWNFIYKPHPFMIDFVEGLENLPDSVIKVDMANINQLIDLVDVTVTILSQAGYISLIRKKPTVILGYTQLKDKDCNYQAFEKDKIEGEIKKALRYGFTDKQKGAFTKHIAQLVKYYLYDDLSERPIRYGRPIPKSWEEVEELGNLLCVDAGGNKKSTR